MSDVEKLNFFRLSWLIFDAGNPTLRCLLEKQYPANGDLETFVKLNSTALRGLCTRKIITQKQMDLLQPSTGIKPSVENLDTSLLTTLLTNVCPIQQPLCGWKASPVASDMSAGADILRLRDARNELFHHAKCGISDAVFQPEWSNVSAAISRLSNQLHQQQQEDIQKKINDIRQADIDSARDKEIRKLIFSETMCEIYQMLKRIDGRDTAIADRGLTVSVPNQSSRNDEHCDEGKDQSDTNMRMVQDTDGTIFVIKHYAALKSELTRGMGMAIAGVLFKEENSGDVLDQMQNASSRRLCIDILLKRVILGKATIVQSFLKELKSRCPKKTDELLQTKVTEEDRKKFQQINDRVQGKGGVSCRLQTGNKIDDSDVEFFQEHLCDLPEDVDQINNVLLSRFHIRAFDHSKVTLCSNQLKKIHVLFEIIRSCHLDSPTELESVLGSSLYVEWMQFRNRNSEPYQEDPGIWQSFLTWLQGAAVFLTESICQTFQIVFLRADRGSIVLKFLAGNDFRVELLKPESVQSKLRELLEKMWPEPYVVFKDPVQVTVFIKSPEDAGQEEIHFHLKTTKDMKDIEGCHSHIGRHERDYMVEEMDPALLKQWMFEKLQIDKSTETHLEGIVSWDDISRVEKMKILIDTLERLENGYKMLEQYCEENDKYIYRKVFGKAEQLSSKEPSQTDQLTELVYEKGGGLQKLFTTWIDFSKNPKEVKLISDDMQQLDLLPSEKQLTEEETTSEDELASDFMPSLDLLPSEKQPSKEEKTLVASPPPSLPDNKLSERQLGRISMKIWRKSDLLGFELGLAGADIKQIQKNYQDAVTQCLMILFKWKLQSGEKATFRNLEKAFISADINIDILKSVNTAGDRVSCLPSSMLDKQPEDSHLMKICSTIGTGHVLLGVELEVSLFRINEILTEHPGDVQRQCYEIMKEWRQNQARQATFRNLEQAFICIGFDPDILKQSVK